MRIRPAVAEDARVVAHVHVRTWQVAYRGLVPDAHLDALDVDTRVAAYDRFDTFGNAERPVFVAEDGGLVVGFAMVGRSREEDDTGELYAIYVDPARWGTKAGAALMTGAETWLAERWPVATLWVLEGNERARAFYERLSWEWDGAVKDEQIGGVLLREVRYRKTFGRR